MKTTEKVLPVTPFSIFTCFHRKWNIFYEYIIKPLAVARKSNFKSPEHFNYLLLLRFLIHPEVNVGSEESKLGEGSEDQQERLYFPVEVNTFHLVKQQEELSEVLKIELV